MRGVLSEDEARDFAELWSKLSDYRIEMAEAAASEKQLLFQIQFFKQTHYKYIALGGNRCLGPDALIDRPDGTRQKVSEIVGHHWVMAYDGKNFIPVLADEPYIKAHEECFRVKFSNGGMLDCTLNHRFLTRHGYKNLEYLMQDVPGQFRRALDGLNVEAYRVGRKGSHQSDTHVCGVEPLGIKPIYDFGVPGYHNYLAGGVINHNSGKSFVCGVMCFAKWLRDYAVNGDEYWCIAPGEKSVGQQQMLWDYLPPFMFGDNVWEAKFGFGRERPTLTLVLPNNRGNAVVRFKTCDQDLSSFEQGKLRGWWADEKLHEDVYTRLIPRTLDLGGWGIYSDINEQGWHYKLDHAAPDSGILFQEFTMFDNKHLLPPDAIKQALKELSPDEARMRVYGKARRSVGVVYREFDAEKHVVEPFQIPCDWKRYTALDYGLSKPTACLFFAIDPMGNIYVYKEYYQRGGNVKEHAAAICAMAHDERLEINFIDPHAKDKDPRQKISIQQQYLEEGWRTKPWPYVQTIGEKVMVEKVKVHLINGTLKIFNTCLNTIREFGMWRFTLDREGNPRSSDSYEAENNHALDCIKGFIGSDHHYNVTPVKMYDYVSPTYHRTANKTGSVV